MSMFISFFSIFSCILMVFCKSSITLSFCLISLNRSAIFCPSNILTLTLRPSTSFFKLTLILIQFSSFLWQTSFIAKSNTVLDVIFLLSLQAYLLHDGVEIEVEHLELLLEVLVVLFLTFDDPYSWLEGEYNYCILVQQRWIIFWTDSRLWSQDSLCQTFQEYYSSRKSLTSVSWSVIGSFINYIQSDQGGTSFEGPLHDLGHLADSSHLGLNLLPIGLVEFLCLKVFFGYLLQVGLPLCSIHEKTQLLLEPFQGLFFLFSFGLEGLYHLVVDNVQTVLIVHVWLLLIVILELIKDVLDRPVRLVLHELAVNNVYTICEISQKQQLTMLQIHNTALPPSLLIVLLATLLTPTIQQCCLQHHQGECIKCPPNTHLYLSNCIADLQGCEKHINGFDCLNCKINYDNVEGKCLHRGIDGRLEGLSWSKYEGGSLHPHDHVQSALRFFRNDWHMWREYYKQQLVKNMTIMMPQTIRKHTLTLKTLLTGTPAFPTSLTAIHLSLPHNFTDSLYYQAYRLTAKLENGYADIYLIGEYLANSNNLNYLKIAKVELKVVNKGFENKVDEVERSNVEGRLMGVFRVIAESSYLYGSYLDNQNSRNYTLWYSHPDKGIMQFSLQLPKEQIPKPQPTPSFKTITHPVSIIETDILFQTGLAVAINTYNLTHYNVVTCFTIQFQDKQEYAIEIDVGGDLFEFVFAITEGEGRFVIIGYRKVQQNKHKQKTVVVNEVVNKDEKVEKKEKEDSDSKGQDEVDEGVFDAPTILSQPSSPQDKQCQSSQSLSKQQTLQPSSFKSDIFFPSINLYLQRVYPQLLNNTAIYQVRFTSTINSNNAVSSIRYKIKYEDQNQMLNVFDVVVENNEIKLLGKEQVEKEDEEVDVNDDIGEEEENASLANDTITENKDSSKSTISSIQFVDNTAINNSRSINNKIAPQAITSNQSSPTQTTTILYPPFEPPPIQPLPQASIDLPSETSKRSIADPSTSAREPQITYSQQQSPHIAPQQFIETTSTTDVINPTQPTLPINQTFITINPSKQYVPRSDYKEHPQFRGLLRILKMMRKMPDNSTVQQIQTWNQQTDKYYTVVISYELQEAVNGSNYKVVTFELCVNQAGFTKILNTTEEYQSRGDEQNDTTQNDTANQKLRTPSFGEGEDVAHVQDGESEALIDPVSLVSFNLSQLQNKREADLLFKPLNSSIQQILSELSVPYSSILSDTNLLKLYFPKGLNESQQISYLQDWKNPIYLVLHKNSSLSYQTFYLVVLNINELTTTRHISFIRQIKLKDILIEGCQEVSFSVGLVGVQCGKCKEKYQLQKGICL